MEQRVTKFYYLQSMFDGKYGGLVIKEVDGKLFSLDWDGEFVEVAEPPPYDDYCFNSVELKDSNIASIETYQQLAREAYFYWKKICDVV